MPSPAAKIANPTVHALVKAVDDGDRTDRISRFEDRAGLRAGFLPVPGAALSIPKMEAAASHG